MIELLVVVAIISLLTSVVLSSLAGARMKANDAKISQDLRQFRIAAELYYNDNHTYPPTAMNYKDDDIALQQDGQKNNWANKLSFFIKTAEAATYHTTPLCANFDKAADAMISLKYLSKRPIHPYDDDANHICYKAVAVNNSATFSAYASLTTQVSAGGGTINKRTGFIIGDTTPPAISSLATFTQSISPYETPYPIGSTGSTSVDLVTSIDAVSGFTNGASGSSNNSIGINSDTSGASTTNSTTTNASTTTYTLTVNKGTVSSGYMITLTYDRMGGAPFTSPTSFAPGTVVSIYAAIYNGMSYKQPMFTGCDSVLGLTNCNVTMNGDRTINVSD